LAAAQIPRVAWTIEQGTAYPAKVDEPLNGHGADAGASSVARPGAILPQNWRIRRVELRLNRLAWPRRLHFTTSPRRLPPSGQDLPVGAQASRRLQAARSSTGLMAPDTD
jgi:hypothetical protein